MVNRMTRWGRSFVLALPCAALYWADVPYRAHFFGVAAEASLVHLHFGYLLALAMLYRDRLPLRMAMALHLAMWLLAVAPGHPPPATVMFGVLATGVFYPVLVLTARAMGWPRADRMPFGVADVSAFVVFALGVLPLVLGLCTLALKLLLVRPLAGPALLGNELVQVLLARFFGALILTLPLVVVGSQGAGPVRWWRVAVSWRLVLIGVGLPMLTLHLAAAWSSRDAVLLDVLLDNRLLIATVLVWAALHIRLRWSMPLLVMVQLLFAAGLARHASDSRWLPDEVGLLRTLLECTMLQLLVLLLMLYDHERTEATAQHLRDSLTEPLSGLPNLAALRRDCDAAASTSLGLLLLDRTEKVSAGLGLRAQAALLRWVSVRLQDLAAVYYLGSGQLALRPLADGGDWDAVLGRLHAHEFVWKAHRLRVLPYLGVVDAPASGARDAGLEERLHRASQAAMEARLRGELHCVRTAATGAEEGLSLRGRQQVLRRESVVLSRIREGDVELYFQPIVPLAAAPATTVSGEVLCRIRDEHGQIMQPGQFLPGLQEDRRMAELDLAVVRRLAAWLETHHGRLPPFGHLGLNVAGQSLASRAFARELLALVDHFPLSPRHLCFEVTETAAILYTRESAQLFEQLRERGCQLAIDDFGVGYQSFERLRQIPVDVIKIDGSFIRDMLRSPRELELVRASVAVAHAFDARTAAEYVGDAATAERLRELGVDWMQGDHVGRAGPIDRILRPAGGGARTDVAATEDAIRRA